MREDTSRHLRLVTPGMKWLLFAASVLVFLVGVQLFILTEQTDRYFAWTIASPLTAAALGGAYWSACTLEFLASRQTVWAHARIAVPAVLFFTSLTLLVTLIHLDRFHLGNRYLLSTQFAAWAWIGVYALVPILMSVLLVFQLRASGGDPPRQYPLPQWVRIVLGLQATVLFLFGAALFLVPAVTLSLWPWPLTPLTARAIGAWLLALGLAAIHALRENDWERVGIATYTYLVLGVLEFLALARYPGAVNWHTVGAWFYVLFLATVLASGIYGVIVVRRLRAR